MNILHACKSIHPPLCFSDFAIAWYSFTLIATVNGTVQLDEQEFKLSANIRYVYVLGSVCVTYNLMLIALAYVSSTIPWEGHRSQRGIFT